MSESGFVDDALPPGGRLPPGSGPLPPGAPRARGHRRRRWAMVVVLVIALVGLPAFAAWVHFGRVHAGDLASWRRLTAQFSILDRTFPVLSYSATPPCEGSTEGRVTRTYSRLGGPTVLEVRDVLVTSGWTETAAPSPAIIRLERSATPAEHHYVVVLVADSHTARGASLTATSSASALACLVGG
ncbi:MAG: hypothetical protein L0H25_11135 [Micrococcales bacterium]|nr:hypothetical protein [Micrococcales bacterium]